MAVLTSLSKSPQGRTCLRLNLSFLWAYGGTNLAFKVPPREDMLEFEPEELVAPTLPGINGQPVLLHLPKLCTALFFMMVKYMFNLHYPVRNSINLYRYRYRTVHTKIPVNLVRYQCCESVTFKYGSGCGSGSSNLYLWLTDTDADPGGQKT